MDLRNVWLFLGSAFVGFLGLCGPVAAVMAQPTSAPVVQPPPKATSLPTSGTAAMTPTPAPTATSTPLASISASSKPTSPSASGESLNPDVSFRATAEEIESRCRLALRTTVEGLDKLVASGQTEESEPTFGNMIKPFEDILADLEKDIGQIYLLSATAPEKPLRDACQRCLRQYVGTLSAIFARSDLYLRFKKASETPDVVDAQDQAMTRKWLKDFVRSGAALPADKAKRVAALNAKIARLSLRFQQNLGEDKTEVLLRAEEVEGIPAGVLATWPKTKDGLFRFQARLATHYIALAQYAKRAETRKKALLARSNIQAEANSKILEEILILRQEMARTLGYKTYAHFVLDDRMAGSPEKVFAFLNKLRPKLQAKMNEELALWATMKAADGGDPTLEAWDWRYYTTQYKQTKFAVRGEEIRQYFPVDHVITGVFAIYQRLLSVRFQEIKPAQAWHPDVRLFATFDQASGRLVSHFYLDLFPRPGKYTHFAAFGFRKGRLLPSGRYQTPLSSVVGNWQRPAKGRPSLLSHDEVVTFFHEFGHIMHQTLTTARYSSLSGTAVKRDFVEAPSQMLENWIWQPSILKSLSRHFQTAQPLPDALIQKMIDAKRVGSGLFWTRQLFLATIDMRYHTRTAPLDTAKVWDETLAEVMPIKRVSGVRPAATFGHLMGYAAGYYGYLWSKVYAQDMFTIFEAKGLLNAEAGARYRHWILEKGGTLEPIDLIRGFLGREPSEAAFARELGL